VVLAQPPEPPAAEAIDQAPTVLFPRDTGEPAFLPRIAISHYTGPGVGYTTSFTTLEGFLPFNPAGTSIVVFGDLHGILNNDAITAANVGGGARYFAPGSNRIFGVSGYFDNRDTGLASFKQGGFGFESLGRYLDFRSNAYFIIGTDNKLVGQSIVTPTTSVTTFTNPTFAGFNILLDQMVTQERVRQFQGAMSGFDVEVGGPVPLLRNYQRGYVGTYNFQGGGNNQAWGARGRLEGYVNQNLTMNLALQNDRLFGTTLVFGAEISFPGIRSRRRNWEDVEARLADPVLRNYNVVIQERATVDDVTTNLGKVVVTDPATGKPIIVEHADANAPAAGQNGSFEHPFTTLGALQASALFANTNIVFVHNGGYPGGITLRPGQRLLGDGITHAFTSQQGTFLLPILVPGAAPTITVADQTNAQFLTACVLVAANTEVSGLSMTPGVFQNGIVGHGFTGAVDINRNTINGPGGFFGIIMLGHVLRQPWRRPEPPV
jgi:hypothetical protein